MGSTFLQEHWVDRMTQSLSLINPDLSEREIRKFVEEEYGKAFTDHKAVIYNSYENITYHTTLGETLDWIQSFKPLIAESGVFFYPKSMKRNLNTEIIKECMLDARTIHKKEMFAALDAGDAFTASVKDIQQGNDKIAANSGYGITLAGRQILNITYFTLRQYGSNKTAAPFSTLCTYIYYRGKSTASPYFTRHSTRSGLTQGIAFRICS